MEVPMKIKIDAIDTLFFKDGKPFSMGEETWADGTFPPSPTVIYGALRTAFFAEHPEEFSFAKTGNDPTINLKITSLALGYGNDEYFPLPLDFVKKKNEDKKDEHKAFLMNATKSIHLSSSSLINNFFTTNSTDEIESIDNAALTLSALKRYLKAAEQETVYKVLTDSIQIEPKVGIGRDKATHTTDEAKLYRVGMRRLADKKDFGKTSNKLSLIVSFEGMQLSPNGILKLGAEGKIASYASLNTSFDVFENTELDSIDDKMFKLYLATPALFEKGWLPDFQNNPVFKDFEIELITASIGKPVNVGGFDMKTQTPKPMRKAVPAGSVYYLKTNNSTFSKIYSTINGDSISDFSANEGFGIAYIGRTL